jgi:uncharacterized protein YunC (DUF1805 family)
MIRRVIKIGQREVEAISWKISSKTLIVIKGKKGYVMCGYLNMKAADKFSDVAIVVTGVSSIGAALKSTAKAVSKEAYKLGIRKNQRIKDVLKIIA